MLRVMLLQSQLPPEMWGAACILACDIYNITPHASLKMQSPYFIRHQKHPDLTFFQPFGCSMIVHRGSDLIEHGKLAPRGERCVYLGIGNAHGRRSFVGYSPRLNRIYATVHAQFDETHFPMRVQNQRVLGRDHKDNLDTESLSLYHNLSSSTPSAFLPFLW